MNPTRILFVLAIIFAVSVCGCGKKQASDAPAVKTSPSASTASSQPPSGQQPPGDSPEPPVVPGEPEKPQLAMVQKQMTLRWVEDGKLRMEATADEFRGNEVAQTGELVGFRGKLYENGKLTATMEAPSAIADTANRIVTATGGVKLRSVVRETSLTSQWVKWYAREQRVIGNGGVKIDSTVGIVEAAAFEADTGLKKFTVKGSPPKL